MEEAIDRVIGDVYRYTEAGERLIERLQLQNRWNVEDIERLRTGVSLTAAIEATDSASRSRDLTRIMAEFEESRRAIRSSVVAASLAEGATVTQISEIFGVSRQLANRFVKGCRAREQLEVEQPLPPLSTR
jgi:hypothetical protein